MTLQVSAEVYDDANPEKRGLGNLTITVRRNERGPRFDRTDYTETLLETTPIGTVVVTLLARDEDDQGVGVRIRRDRESDACMYILDGKHISG